MKRIFLFFCVNVMALAGFCQYTWKLEKDKDGIKVYSAAAVNSSFRTIKVECLIPGTYEKLVAVLNDIPRYSTWIYHSKNARLLKQNSPHDFIYHTVTEMPWPFSNRDAVIHIQVNTQNLPAMLTITGTGESGYFPKTGGMVRVEKYFAHWKVTMPSPQTLAIVYQVEVDPGGSIPAWIANMFVDKGPYETFSNLARKMKMMK